MIIEWKTCSPGYEASSTGQIRNIKTGLILKQFKHKDGYIRTQFGGKTRLVHRVIAITFLPRQEGKEFVNHKDGNKANNSLENLEWCTRSENLKHAYRIGLKTSAGHKNSRAKLSEEDVQEIKRIYRRNSKTLGTVALAKRYGVARQTISAVLSGQNWKSISD